MAEHSSTGNKKKKIAAAALGALVLPSTLSFAACSFPNSAPSDPGRAQNVSEVYGPAEPVSSDADDDVAGDNATLYADDDDSEQTKIPKVTALYGPAQG